MHDGFIDDDQPEFCIFYTKTITQCLPWAATLTAVLRFTQPSTLSRPHQPTSGLKAWLCSLVCKLATT